ncbi:MAG: hypothetical protein WCC26_20180 [Terracidiphilus sp.]
MECIALTRPMRLVGLVRQIDSLKSTGSKVALSAILHELFRIAVNVPRRDKKPRLMVASAEGARRHPLFVPNSGGD